MPIIPLSCPSCGANLTVESSLDAAICEFCGKPYIVKDAIVNNYVNLYVGKAIINTDTVNIVTQKDFDIKAGTLVKYLGECQEVTVPANVKEIGQSSFANLNITNVVIPDGVTKICRSAFERCGQLKKVSLPESLKEIEPSAFAWSGIEKIVIPNSVTGIDSGAFEFCSELKDVQIPSSATVYPYAFRGTPFWEGKCQTCGKTLSEASFMDTLRGYTKACKKCGLVYK